MKALAALALCACGGATGTISVELVTAPGSHVLDAVQRLRMTLSDPHQVVEATRTATGFDLALEFDASAGNGALLVEGFDAGGALVACGESPAFSVTAITAQVVVYVAPPRSIAAAPVGLGAARSQVVATPLSYGAAIAGGLEGPDGAATPSSSIAVYNAYIHELLEGIPLPAPRAAMAIGSDAAGGVYLFGGTGSDGKPTGTLWRFDTTAPPKGAITLMTDQPSLARSGEVLVPLGNARFLVTGSPVLEIANGAVSARSEVAGLPPAGASVISGDPTAIFAGAALVRFRNDQFDTLPGAGRGEAAAVTLPDGRIAVLGGPDAPGARDALIIDGATGAVTTAGDALSVARRRPAVAATARHVVVAGGSDAADAPIASADVLDARTLARIATLPILPRTGGFAVALPSDQVLLGGGAPASATLELYTPEPP